MSIQIMIKLNPHVGLFSSHTTNRSLNGSGFQLHSQIRSEAFQEISSHMCSTHDLKGVGEIRGGAWLEPKHPPPRCSFRNSLSWPESAEHLGPPQPLTSLQTEEWTILFLPVINTHDLMQNLLPRITTCITHAPSFILASWSPLRERSLSLIPFRCSPAILGLSHTPKTPAFD